MGKNRFEELADNCHHLNALYEQIKLDDQDEELTVILDNIGELVKQAREKIRKAELRQIFETLELDLDLRIATLKKCLNGKIEDSDIAKCNAYNTPRPPRRFDLRKTEQIHNKEMPERLRSKIKEWEELARQFWPKLNEYVFDEKYEDENMKFKVVYNRVYNRYEFFLPIEMDGGGEMSLGQSREHARRAFEVAEDMAKSGNSIQEIWDKMNDDIRSM